VEEDLEAIMAVVSSSKLGEMFQVQEPLISQEKMDSMVEMVEIITKKYSPQSGDQSSNSYGGGGGGAGADGSGGRIWIYHKGDLTVSNILYAGGSGGSGGAAGTSAGGGGNGVNGGAGALVNVQL